MLGEQCKKHDEQFKILNEENEQIKRNFENLALQVQHLSNQQGLTVWLKINKNIEKKIHLKK